MNDFLKKNIDLFVGPVLFSLAYVAMNATGIAHTSVWEYLSVLFGIISIMLLKREWPAGYIAMLTSNIFSIIYFLKIGLFGQTVSGIVFAIIAVVSFYFWIRPDKKTRKVIQPSFARPIWWAFVILMSLVIIIWRYNAGAIGILDWMLVFFGLFGFISMIRKKTDAWVLWLSGDLGSLVLFWMTGSYLFFLRSFIYIYNNSSAYIDWRKKSSVKID
ncbi:MAG: nicotinamide riboside transporter PnuC [Alphaproteobacteria bacterium]|nr:nicotinamide riboside transporter PnuC [Alphaproteobacteria bacterium]